MASLVPAFFELCHSWYSLPMHLLFGLFFFFFFFGLTIFVISIEKRLVTSTNLEYSFIFFCPQVN